MIMTAPLYPRRVLSTLAKFNSGIIDPENGFITCPGRHRHTTPDKPSDAKLWHNMDKTWVVSCFHASCKEERDLLNRKLLAAPERWDYTPLPARDEAEVKERRALKAEIKGLLPTMLVDYAWPMSAIEADSPEVIKPSPREQWCQLLSLFSSTDIVWCGELTDSGWDKYRHRFKTAWDWMKVDDCPGSFTCPSTFAHGSFSRSGERVASRPFLVVESDVLDRDTVGAVFRFLAERYDMRLRAVVDTAGKSLHGWFDMPPGHIREEMKIVLPLLKCDPKMLNASQPCRLPGAVRDGKLQRLIYLAD